MPSIVYFAVLGLLGVILFFNLFLLVWLAVKTIVCLARLSQSRRRFSERAAESLSGQVLAGRP